MATERGRTALAVSIVLFRPDSRLLESTLRTLGNALARAREGRLDRTEVILIDHSPTAQPAAAQAAWRRLLGPETSVIYDHTGANPGFGAGHNRAFARCRPWADYFLVANPDLEFAPDSLAAGLDFLAQHPAVGLLAPALIETNGKLRPACFRAPDPLTLLARLLGGSWARARSYRYECRDWDANVVVFNPPLVSGCCMLWRAAAYAELGGFDPGYFLYFEDFDLSRRANSRGLSAYCPAMKIGHFGGGAARKGMMHTLLFLRSAARFFGGAGRSPQAPHQNL